MNINFLYVKDHNLDNAYIIFKSKNITILPVVNDNFEIVDVITINEIYNYLEDRKYEKS